MTNTSTPGSVGLSKVMPQLGFSLIEMAVALVVLTLVIGSMLVPLAMQSEQRQVKETQRALNEINEALIGYALAQTPPHLPCPDKTGSGGAGTANDGIEDFDATTGVCADREGNIPWATLGVASSDPWGNRFRYLVTPAFSNRSPASVMSLSSTGDLKVCSIYTCASGTDLASGLPAIVLSHGKNGLGAINSNTNTSNPNPGTSNDELENTPSGTSATIIVSRTQAQIGASAQEFDDIVTWLSPNVLFNRMVAAAKLP